jgi:asparagine synthase (glutamine-hydrolysing)
MCGIAGVLGTAADVGEPILARMAAAITHRGPDDHGVWRDEDAGIGFGHARLSIVDLSAAGHQPMQSPGGRYALAFNGEIYNHLALRAEYERDGGRTPWRGHSDTETLLAAFERWGVEATLRKCVGMFALGLWDRDERTLILARDRLGEKPLFYGWQGDRFLFGSELKAMRAHPAFRADIDPGSVAKFLRFAYVPSPCSIYRGINKLLPGTILRIRAGDRSAQPVPYWSLLEVAQRGLAEPFPGSEDEARQELESRLSRSIALQRVADVPLGAFLSGGIDSSLIVALMQAQADRPVRTFTIGFREAQYDEAAHARAVARHLGTDHTELYVTPDEARAVIPRLPSLYDEPFADVSQIPTFLVSQLARRHVTVSLSGDGGDELFGGYNRYAWARRLLKVPAPARRAAAVALRMLSPGQWDQLASVLGPVLPRRVQVRRPGDQAHKLAGVLGSGSDGGMYERMVSIWPDVSEVTTARPDEMLLSGRWREAASADSPEHRMMIVDMLTYLSDDILCKVDRAAMAVSLETRVPFLDHRVVEFAWRLPLCFKIRNGAQKWILRQVLHRHVPRSLVERPKMGFGVPIDAWLRGPLRQWAEDLLSESRLRDAGDLRPALVRAKWLEHLSGRRNWQYQLWNVLMLQAWRADQRA